MKRHSTSSSLERSSKGAKLNECKVSNLVHYQSILNIIANFIFIKLLDDAQVIPSIEQSLFTNIFAVMTGNGKKAPHYLKEYFTLFCELITVDRESLKSINYSIIFSIAGKQYEVLVRNHIHETHERRSITYFLNMMSDNNSSNCCKELPVASRKALAYFIYKQKNKVQSHLGHHLSHAVTTIKKSLKT